MSFQDWIDHYPALLDGLYVSLKVTGLSLLLGMPLGLLLALGAGSQSRAIRAAVIGLVEIGRGIPALVMLQIVYFGLPSAGVTLSALLSPASPWR